MLAKKRKITREKRGEQTRQRPRVRNWRSRLVLVAPKNNKKKNGKDFWGAKS